MIECSIGPRQISGLSPGFRKPTEMTFSNDPNVYSGIYFANTSAGTVKIQYSKGSAVVRFNGLVFTTGIFSPIANSDLYSRGGRITPRSGRA